MTFFNIIFLLSPTQHISPLSGKHESALPFVLGMASLTLEIIILKKEVRDGK